MGNSTMKLEALGDSDRRREATHVTILVSGYLSENDNGNTAWKGALL